MRVLLIEDDVEIAEGVRMLLERRKFAVHVAHDGDAGFTALSHDHFDVAIVDVGLPKCDGFTIARQARAAGILTPMLMLTARDAVEDRVRGLDAGADDYLVKPFSLEELLARINAVLRRPQLAIGTILRAGNVAVDTAALTVAIDAKPVDLPRREFGVLLALMRQQGRPVSRDKLLDALYSFDAEVTPNAIEAAVSRLRRRLDAHDGSVTVIAMRGLGYVLTDHAKAA